MNEESVTEANNRFASGLYRTLAADPANSGKNIFFSPFSISSALAITYEGARGATADEVRTACSFPEDRTVLREGYRKISARLNTGDPAYKLSTANDLWAEKSNIFLPEYIRVAKEYYGADVTNLDFVDEPEDSRLFINKRVGERTHDLIKDLLPSGSIHKLTRLIITNAVYFLGTWEKQFDRTVTREADFRVSEGKTVRVDMMHQSDEDAEFGYTSTDSLQVLSIRYKGEERAKFSMLVLLPMDNDLSAAESVLDPRKLARLKSLLAYRRVIVFMPRFRLGTVYSLPPALAAMGMPTAFSTAADFSGMDGSKELLVNDVVHKAFIEVDEEGTEASAATAELVAGAMPPGDEPEPVPVFRADHPFVFLIQDEESGTVLFMGRVADPTA